MPGARRRPGREEPGSGSRRRRAPFVLLAAPLRSVWPGSFAVRPAGTLRARDDSRTGAPNGGTRPESSATMHEWLVWSWWRTTSGSGCCYAWRWRTTARGGRGQQRRGGRGGHVPAPADLMIVTWRGGMNGFGCVRQVRRFSDAPIVLVSARGHARHRRRLGGWRGRSRGQPLSGQGGDRSAARAAVPHRTAGVARKRPDPAGAQSGGAAVLAPHQGVRRGENRDDRRPASVTARRRSEPALQRRRRTPTGARVTGHAGRRRPGSARFRRTPACWTVRPSAAPAGPVAAPQWVPDSAGSGQRVGRCTIGR